MKKLIYPIILLLFISLAFAATKDQAQLAISDSETILGNLQQSDDPYLFVSDTLISARQAFERAEYAEMLENKSLEGELVDKARAALAGLNYEGFDYETVINLTDDIKAREQRTYYIKDSIRALELEIDDVTIDTSDITLMLDEARTAYHDERFDDAESKISEIHVMISDKLSEQTSTNTLISTGKYLVARFWMTFLLFLLIIVVALFLFWGRIKRFKLNKKYKHMMAERKVLLDLMRKAQSQRYQKAEISDYLYKVKMKKYRERLAKIDAELPVLKKQLRK